jgi:cell division protein FtsN
MSKDYAKYKKKKAANDKTRRTDLFVVFFLALVIAATIAWACIHKMQTVIAQNAKTSVVLTKIQNFFHHKTNNKEMVVNTKPPAVAVKQQDEVRFDFYNDLPTMQMTASVDDATKTTSVAVNGLNNREKSLPPAITQNEKTLYTLRLAAFKDEAGASQLRISMLLSGVDVEIVRVGDNYRVQQGSYSTLSQAKAMQKQLQKKGIESVIEEI